MSAEHAEGVRPSFIVTPTENFWMCSLCGALLAHPSIPIHTDWHAPHDGSPSATATPEGGTASE